MHSWAQPNFSGIAVNEKWGTDIDRFTKSLAENVKTQYHPMGCDTVKSLADHELGHQLDDLLLLSSKIAIINLYNAALK